MNIFSFILQVPELYTVQYSLRSKLQDDDFVLQISKQNTCGRYSCLILVPPGLSTRTG